MCLKPFKKWTAALTAVSLLLAAIAVASPGPGEKPPANAKPNLVVHEWGTFLTVQGSDGVTLGGMVASEEVLPPFVESRSIATFNRTYAMTKMETPVTYFYTDRPQAVSVRVDMPKGLLTHWYPMVRQFGPEPLADLATAAKGSYLDWARVELLPQTSTSPTAAGTPVPAPRQVKSEDTWRFARETDAALVKVCSRKGDPKNFGREFDY